LSGRRRGDLARRRGRRYGACRLAAHPPEGAGRGECEGGGGAERDCKESRPYPGPLPPRGKGQGAGLCGREDIASNIGARKREGSGRGKAPVPLPLVGVRRTGETSGSPR